MSTESTRTRVPTIRLPSASIARATRASSDQEK
jgi:hypothetical protein